ncbi:hypothetical protein E2P81_ATG10416 [Venturia nashicola]|nr:hypothetical protein E2P81_ATG10416 [Venturia nashicola]
MAAHGPDSRASRADLHPVAVKRARGQMATLAFPGICRKRRQAKRWVQEKRSSPLQSLPWPATKWRCYYQKGDGASLARKISSDKMLGTRTLSDPDLGSAGEARAGASHNSRLSGLHA